MKLLTLLLSSLTLVACGGGTEQAATPPIPTIKANVPTPVKNATTVSGGNGVVIHMYQALYGIAPSNAMLIDYTAQATADASVFARNLTASFTGTSSTALAKLVLDNLGERCNRYQYRASWQSYFVCSAA